LGKIRETPGRDNLEIATRVGFAARRAENNAVNSLRGLPNQEGRDDDHECHQHQYQPVLNQTLPLLQFS
jgi:hypothetical protein